MRNDMYDFMKQQLVQQATEIGTQKKVLHALQREYEELTHSAAAERKELLGLREQLTVAEALKVAAEDEARSAMAHKQREIEKLKRHAAEAMQEAKQRAAD